MHLDTQITITMAYIVMSKFMSQHSYNVLMHVYNYQITPKFLTHYTSNNYLNNFNKEIPTFTLSTNTSSLNIPKYSQYSQEKNFNSNFTIHPLFSTNQA